MDSGARRVVSFALLVAVLVALVLPASACQRPGRGTATAPRPSETEASAVLRFGPVYRVGLPMDPVVAAALRGASVTDAVSAEIRGYLVDWAVSEGGGVSQGGGKTIYELAVMKDGGLYRTETWRPAAAWDETPPARLVPESAEEALLRGAALGVAHAIVARSRPVFARAKPIVWNYLVRIRRSNGTAVDVWVDPDVRKDRFDYGVRLRRTRE